MWRSNGIILETRQGAIPLFALLEKAEFHREQEVTNQKKHMWSIFITYVTISYVLSLRGNEGFLMDIGRTLEYWKRNDGRYFYMALWGKIKLERSPRLHLISCINVTGSGIKVKHIVKRALMEKKHFGHEKGWLISDWKQERYNSMQFYGILFHVPKELYDTHKKLFPPFIKQKMIFEHHITVSEHSERHPTHKQLI